MKLSLTLYPHKIPDGTRTSDLLILACFVHNTVICPLIDIFLDEILCTHTHACTHTHTHYNTTYTIHTCDIHTVHELRTPSQQPVDDVLMQTFLWLHTALVHSVLL